MRNLSSRRQEGSQEARTKRYLTPLRHLSKADASGIDRWSLRLSMTGTRPFTARINFVEPAFARSEITSNLYLARLIAALSNLLKQISQSLSGMIPFSILLC